VWHIKLEKTMARNSNLEFLRILSMLLIIMHHYSVHGAFVLDPGILTTNKVIVQILSAGGKLGVNCFILITGYFMIESSFKVKKLLKLVCEIFFYSAILFAIFTAFGLADFSAKLAIKSFFPTIFSIYWFATAYVVLYVFSPYLNVFIKGLDEKKHLNLILLLIVLWSVIPTFTTAAPGMSNLSWFMTLYIVAAYIRLYPNKWFEKDKLNIWLALSTYTLILSSFIFLDIIGLRINAVGIRATYFISMNNLPMLFCAITLFLGFKNLKIKDNKIINGIAASMFGVYLIHDNYFVRPFIWKNVFQNSAYYDSPYLIIHALIVTFLVFVACVVVDQIRIKLIEEPFFKLVDKKWNGITVLTNIFKNKFEVILARICDKA
jgi:surface polysaccharide O-acyltransferase-like enzyme